MIQRFFHPVGQGAFYSERHDNINIVFDCGTEWKNRGKKGINKVITNSFRKNEVIDILFISHFDYDHISRIGILKENVKIRNAVLPLLYGEEKFLVANFYELLKPLDPNLPTLVKNPEEYFGEKTKIIYIRGTSDIEKPMEVNMEPQNIDAMDSQDLENGKSLVVDGLKDWVFIPFNHQYTERNRALKQELKRNNVGIEELSAPEFTALTKPEYRRKIRAAYDSLEGKINQNSMFVYSGPVIGKNFYRLPYVKNFSPPLFHMLRIRRGWPWYERHKAGCLYTGDGDLNVVDIKNVFKSCWDNIGTIQIPHHGAIQSFNKTILEDTSYMCPISFGKNNSYDHPSNQVIVEILLSGSMAICVTEDLDSIYVEVIEN